AVLVLLALLLNLSSVAALRRNDYDSLRAGLGWVASLALLAAAFAGPRPRAPHREAVPVAAREEPTDWRLPRGAEIAIVLALFALARQLFGVRTAILAALFVAISDVAIHFSRQEFSNVTTPLLLVTGFFLFFRGLRNRRPLLFVLAAYAHEACLYFYLG